MNKKTIDYLAGHRTGMDVGRAAMYNSLTSVIRQEIRAYEHLLEDKDNKIEEKSELRSIKRALEDILVYMEVEG